MKEYKIEAVFIDDKERGMRSIQWIINGKEGDLPEELKKWIARDVLFKLLELTDGK